MKDKLDKTEKKKKRNKQLGSMLELGAESRYFSSKIFLFIYLLLLIIL